MISIEVIGEDISLALCLPLGKYKPLTLAIKQTTMYVVKVEGSRYPFYRVFSMSQIGFCNVLLLIPRFH